MNLMIILLSAGFFTVVCSVCNQFTLFLHVTCLNLLYMAGTSHNKLPTFHQEAKNVKELGMRKVAEEIR